MNDFAVIAHSSLKLHASKVHWILLKKGVFIREVRILPCGDNLCPHRPFGARIARPRPRSTCACPSGCAWLSGYAALRPLAALPALIRCAHSLGVLA